MLSESVVPFSSLFAGSVSFVCSGTDPVISSHMPPDAADIGWELIYVNQGELMASFEGCHFILSPGSFLIRPLSVCGFSCSADVHSLSLTVFSFSCSSPFLFLLSGQILHAAKSERLLLMQLFMRVMASSRPSSAPVRAFLQDRPFQSAALSQRPAAYFSDAFQTNSFMEYMLNRMFIRRFPPSCPAAGQPAGSFFPAGYPDHQYLSILRYLKNHLFTQLSIVRICQDNLISRSRLEQLFHKHGWHGVIDCFSHMKIDAAKRLILHGAMTFTQISSALGYSSVSYFSRQFKEKTKMTPSEYSSFLKEHPGDVIPSFKRYYSVSR